MRIISFLLAAALTTALVYGLDMPQQLGDRPLPPMGPFINPFTGFWQQAAPEPNQMPEQVNLKGLKAPVEVVYDSRLVPHIFAQNTLDAVRMQGYITAQHRLWQMDIATRKAAGRLSEILGVRTLALDKEARREGILTSARRAVKAWESDEPTRKLINAYTEGVNAYIQQLAPANYPLEFKLLNYAPEPWSNLKSALFVKSMALTLCRKEKDVAYTRARLRFGRDTFDMIYPEKNPQQSPIIPDSAARWQSMPPLLPAPDTQAVGQLLPGSNSRYFPEGIGSNNWAVSGSKTLSGYPILCNDPHLKLTLPAIWFEMQLHTPDFNTYGATLPGLPGVIIGFNEHIAWGETNTSWDVADWYSVKWSNEQGTQYRLDEETLEVEPIVEKIFVKGYDAPVLDTVKYTVWGPVVEDDGKTGMALRWVAHDAPSPKEAAFFVLLNQSKGYKDFDKIGPLYTAPTQNFVFASREGDIALHVNGKLPIKGASEGQFVQSGNTAENNWKGFIPYARLPQMHQPQRGFVASANQRSTGPDYPYDYFGFFDDYRGRYLNRRLERMEQINLDSMARLQTDNYSLFAEEGVPALLQNLNQESLNGDQKKGVAQLKDWNLHFDPEQQAPLLFIEWYRNVYALLWDEIFAEEGLPMPDRWRTLELLRKSPGHPLCDIQSTPEKETARDLVSQAFQKAWESLGEKLKNPEFTWGKEKTLTIQHLGRLNAFNVESLYVGGYGQSLNAVQAEEGKGPSWRMIVSLGPQIEALGVYPGGQSGNPGSPYYDNMVETWVRGEYYQLKFMQSPDDIEGQVLKRQTFQ